MYPSWERSEKDKKKWKENDDKFLFDIDADILSKYKEGSCLHNAEKNTEWALRTFEAIRINKLHYINSIPQLKVASSTI